MEIITREESLATYAAEGELDLVELVGNATWKELIIKLVETNKLDPWNIDITKVVDSYIETVRKIRLLDLFLPANVIFAASVLLRIKSDSIQLFEQPDDLPAEEEREPRIVPEVEPLVPKERRQPPSKITLQQLVEALDEVMKLEAKRSERKIFAATPLRINLDIEDIDEKISGVYKIVKEKAGAYGVTTFEDVAMNFSNSYSILVDLFVPLLYLHHRGDVTMEQEEFFRSIIIKIANKKAVK